MKVSSHLFFQCGLLFLIGYFTDIGVFAVFFCVWYIFGFVAWVFENWRYAP